MLEFIGFCAIIYLIVRFGGVMIKTVLEIFLALVLFFIALPFILWLLTVVFSLFTWGLYGY